MRLYSLLKNVGHRMFGSSLVDVSGLYHKHSDVESGGLFFCINGKNFSGEDYAKEAVKNGAVAVVTEKEIIGIHGTSQVIVKDVRSAMSKIACNFYGNPACKLKIIGVTGTNGKTTTTHMIAGFLESYGKKCAIIGTNGVVFGDEKIETGMTTPDPIELQKIFLELNKKHIEYVCMEVSAHSIFLNKLDGIKFELMIFTNLTEDHLDFFETMENYYLAKAKIFTSLYTKIALINIDDFYGKRLFESIKINKFTYAIDSEANYNATEIKLNNFKQEFYFDNQKIITGFLGKFNIYNLLSAMASVKILGFNLTNLQNRISNLKSVDGRFNTMVINKKLFIVDYAHTPDGLENVLKLCKSILNGQKLICIFGCGGNRETQKRSKMGEISSIYADLTIISSDNPRFEDRMKIAKEIECGVLNNNYKIILDRVEAIKFADKISDEGDVILVAGKGNENYIDEQGVKIYYSDYDEIKKLES